MLFRSDRKTFASVLKQRLAAAADAKMADKMAGDATIWRQVEKQILLDRLDHYWKEHLATLDALRQCMAEVDAYYKDHGIFQGKFGFGKRPAYDCIVRG